MPSTSTFNKVDKVTMKGLAMLKNSLGIGGHFSNEYADEYLKREAIGAVLRVPMTQRYNVQRNNMTYNPQALDRPFTTIEVSETATVAIDWYSIEKALDMERGEDRVEEIYLKPAVAQIRQEIEIDLAAFAGERANMITGALGTNPTTYDATSAVSLQLLTEMGCPDEDLALFLPPVVNRSVKTASSGFYNPTVDVSKQFRTGYVQQSDSFDWYRSMSLKTHTAGTWAGAVTVNGAGQSGSTLVLTATTGDTFKKGDKIAIAGVNHANLMTRTAISTSAAGTQTFSIMSDVTAAASAATVTIFPPIYGPGSHYQNVDALPATGAALTLWPGTSSPNGKVGKLGLALHKNAFHLAGVKLEEPEAVEICRQYQDPDTGIALRFIRQWDSINSRMTNRFDCLWGRGIGLGDQCAVVIACA